jgi:Beta-carotene isomerase D27-like, C-terminal
MHMHLASCLHTSMRMFDYLSQRIADIVEHVEQTFFTEQLGMPLTMEPDFETYECTMSFGKRPPPVSEDEAARQPCLAGCPSGRATGSPSQPCHKLQ